MTTYPPTLLIASIPYGLSVWQDAAGGWHEKFGPSLTDLDGARYVFAGGRVHTLTDDEYAALVAAGYGDYIVADPTDPIATVGLTRVGDAAHIV